MRCVEMGTQGLTQKADAPRKRTQVNWKVALARTGINARHIRDLFRSNHNFHPDLLADPEHPLVAVYLGVWAHGFAGVVA